jgi:diguanylate cyclase (GGDEF)-like protein
VLLASGFAAVIALATVWAWRLHDPSELLPIPWWSLAAGFFVAERAVIRMHVRSVRHSVSLTAAPFVVGLITVSPVGLIGAQLVGAGAALALRPPRSWSRGAGELVRAGLGSAAGMVLFRLLVRGHDPFHAAGWLAALVAAGVAGLVALAAGRVDDLVTSRRATSGELRVAVPAVLGSSLTVASLAIAATTLAESRPGALFLLILPAAAFIVIVRDYVSGRRSHDQLQWFYDWGRRRRDPDLDSALSQLLLSACRLLHADYAEILLLPLDSREDALRSSLSPDGELLIEARQISTDDENAIEWIRSRGGFVRLSSDEDGDPAALRAYARERSLRDLTITTLEGDSALLGLLFVGNRTDDVSTFGNEDEKLFRTFAGHATLLLENEQLEQSLAKLTDLEAQLRHQALHDALTGLPNRRLFHARVDESLRQADADGSEPVVLFLDLDGFKAINDDLGHAAGDELLVAFSERLRSHVRPEELPARLGGDEFAVLIESGGTEVAEDVAQRLVHAVRNPFSIQGRRLSVRLSIGIATATGAVGVEELLANADLAMYAAKAEGSSSYALYSELMRGSAQARKQLGEALEEALERDQIAVHYQPIVDLRTGATVAFEALARWRRGKADTLTAADFLPAAEEGALIERIGQFVMRAACVQTQEWRSEDTPRELSVCVNLSPVEFYNPRLGVDVATALLESGLDASRLILEITEHVATDDAEATLATMSELRRLGVRFALDQFGTGRTSLEQLCQLPFDVVKIARPLVERIGAGPGDERMTRAIIGLAKSLGLKVVAEGIESKEQAERLRQLGCHLGQGFYFDRALAVAQATRRLRTPPAGHLRLVAADTA